MSELTVIFRTIYAMAFVFGVTVLVSFVGYNLLTRPVTSIKAAGGLLKFLATELYRDHHGQSTSIALYLLIGMVWGMLTYRILFYWS